MRTKEIAKTVKPADTGQPHS